MKLKFKNNRISYGQDFNTFCGVPTGIPFRVSRIVNDKVQLIADGYGDFKTNYGNGAIYVSLNNLPEKVTNKILKEFGE
jgi:hypothetical protein